jgi:hypothetical protein
MNSSAFRGHPSGSGRQQAASSATGRAFVRHALFANHLYSWNLQYPIDRPNPATDTDFETSAKAQTSLLSRCPEGDTEGFRDGLYRSAVI